MGVHCLGRLVKRGVIKNIFSYKRNHLQIPVRVGTLLLAGKKKIKGVDVKVSPF